jgi:hypothetical protein
MDELRERLQAVISAGDDLRYDEYGVSEFPLGHLARKWDDAKAAMEAFMAQPVPAEGAQPTVAQLLDRLVHLAIETEGAYDREAAPPSTPASREPK